MNPNRLTMLLSLLLAASTVCAAVAWSSLTGRRAAASAACKDLSICRGELSALSAAGPADHRRTAPDDPDVNRRIREAAASAGLVDQITDIDPGTPVRAADSEVIRTPIRIRVGVTTLRQLVVFLRDLSAADDAVDVSDIDLTPAVGDNWAADVTVGLTAHDPRRPGSP